MANDPALHVGAIPGEGWFAAEKIDLTGVRSITLNCGWQAAPKIGATVEVRLDAPDGKLLGKATMPVVQKDQKTGVTKLPIETVTDGKFHSIYFIYKSPEKIQGGVTALRFNGN